MSQRRQQAVVIEISTGPDVGNSSIASVLPSDSPSVSSIFRVHQKLREVNEKAYEPDIVSIGPYHRGKRNLQMMEMQKLRYLQLFLEQRNMVDPGTYIDALRPLEEKARRCYAESVHLEPNEFVEIMLLDGLFIIEVILRFNGLIVMAREDHRIDLDDPIFKMQWMVNSLQRDLMLFENQLPSFVLIEILCLVGKQTHHQHFFDMAFSFFSDLLPGASDDLRTSRYGFQILHLLELVHKCWRPSSVIIHGHSSGVEKRASCAFIPSTTELQEAGVKLKAAGVNLKDMGVPLFDIIFEGTKLREAGVRLRAVGEELTDGNESNDMGVRLFDIKFEGEVMQIPSLTIEDRTGSVLRNLIAFEQYRPSDISSPYTDYVRFLDCLIDTPKDVQILSRLGIIKNWLSDDEDVSTMINKISGAVVAPRKSFQYVDIFSGVNHHCSRRWNRWMAMLKRDYFNSPWAWISVLAAVVLHLLTITQTVFAIFPRK